MSFEFMAVAAHFSNTSRNLASSLRLIGTAISRTRCTASSAALR
jgi:hypothetical protein